MVVADTSYRAETFSSTRLSSGYLSLPMNTPSKNPYWNGDHGWMVMSLSRQ